MSNARNFSAIALSALVTLTLLVALVSGIGSGEAPSLEQVPGDHPPVYMAQNNELSAQRMANRIGHVTDLDETHGFELTAPEGYRSDSVVDHRIVTTTYTNEG